MLKSGPLLNTDPVSTYTVAKMSVTAISFLLVIDPVVQPEPAGLVLESLRFMSKCCFAFNFVTEKHVSSRGRDTLSESVMVVQAEKHYS